MDKKDTTENDIRIEQINPRTELTDLEKTAILQFEIEKQEEELSKTKQFKILNSKKKNTKKELEEKEEIDLSKTGEFKILNARKQKNNSIDLPVKKTNLGDTIKLKLSDLRNAIDEKNMQLPVLKKRKSLYDTVIIKLDDLINSKNALKNYHKHKVTNVEETPKRKKKIHLFKPKDITKIENFKINVDSEEFGRQLYNLNKYALNIIGKNQKLKIRKDSPLAKLETIEKVNISDINYLRYKKKISKFAINKLYYKFAPKETKKYKLYKYSVMISGLVFVITSLIIVDWFVQGAQINNLSHSITEATPIESITDGTLYNINPVDISSNNDKVTDEEKSMYWKYLNTPLASVEFSDLLKQNKDTVGWLIVNNTNINYPVVQAKDNDYYLSHAFDKSSNSAGWVFADFRNDFSYFSNNTVIYAHGRKDKVMFGSLVNALSEKWYKNKDNQLIQFSTLKYNTMWQIISIYKIQAESYYITTDFKDDESFKLFAETMIDRSIYDFGVKVNKNDKLLTLSTCYNDNGIRLVVQAKLVKIQAR